MNFSKIHSGLESVKVLQKDNHGTIFKKERKKDWGIGDSLIPEKILEHIIGQFISTSRIIW